ncbi:MAG: hypothetical protein KBG20_14355 [Caldilineaceae bacterium]|nr:hypothetical protein [Caldilineaceae bacterium]MBP8108298.1 hypothetical protein [Caldilineaceae bacterium]MBP8123167.1 hypothetical protein [Caldilineaceae bacterium]MBP9073485.1 hypothetical protein [Caldilineaceae bacterium]
MTTLQKAFNRRERRDPRRKSLVFLCDLCDLCGEFDLFAVESEIEHGFDGCDGFLRIKKDPF